MQVVRRQSSVVRTEPASERLASGVWRLGSPPGGFTLIELLVVLAVIALLVSIVAPRAIGGVARAEEAVLKQDLAVMRDALDKHYSDAGRYPANLQDLVAKRYLRSIPVDPLTKSSATWMVVAPADPEKGAVYDVRSGAQGVGSNGQPYGQW